MPDLQEAFRLGQIANIESVAQSREYIVQGGPAHGMRVVDVRVAGGIDLRVLPDRGLDIGDAWFRGVPLAWTSAVGEHRPASPTNDRKWVDTFGGGLVVTCGLENVGAPSEGHGLHGRFTYLAASHVQTATITDSDGLHVIVEGTIRETSAVDRNIEVRRRIDTAVGRGRLVVEDHITNRSSNDADCALLYHFNFGYPLIDADTTVDVDSDGVEARDVASYPDKDSWRRPGLPVAGAEELVVEHRVRQDGNGRSSASITNRSLGLSLSVDWGTETLPRLHQWTHRRPGVYVVALEPANAGVRGQAYDREAGRNVVLGAGESFHTSLVVEVSEVRARTEGAWTSPRSEPPHDFD